jgi:hypothetical protein
MLTGVLLHPSRCPIELIAISIINSQAEEVVVNLWNPMSP